MYALVIFYFTWKSRFLENYQSLIIDFFKRKRN